MAWPKEKKEYTRKHIVEIATTLFMRHGYEAISIEDIMEKAKLTRGGFYNHFSSKSALYHESIFSAIEQGKVFFAKTRKGNLNDFIKYYLSYEHYSSPTVCPLSSITPDIMRHSEDIRQAYDQSLSAFIKGIQEKSYNENTQKKISRQQALQIATLLIGGMTLARAINDQDTIREILLVSQKNALTILGNREIAIRE